MVAEEQRTLLNVLIRRVTDPVFFGWRASERAGRRLDHLVKVSMKLLIRGMQHSSLQCSHHPSRNNLGIDRVTIRLKAQHREMNVSHLYAAPRTQPLACSTAGQILTARE
eukprot:CAMPEP_0115850432 /NCGR_PEP_ID=MMETSP0287-20121206/11961_1 /TAXON_ID=412157 /ORGANISM="Chrysochromulina rotalis, Strain UIO044" /LENGTH=109 /DNA_ID=CAMNT_0003304429 /DNA_START=334 /DNA_END=660 /DNA_ORIENTATION=-